MNDARPTIITIAPVRKSIRVGTRQARAFEVFTAGLGRWWPKTHKIGPAPLKTSMIEPRVGGRWYEIGEDGSETTVGHILAWEPPRRFVVSWEIAPNFKPQSGIGSEVEVRFIAEGEDATRIELEHRLFERMGEEGGQVMHDAVERGWPGILELFKTEAEK